ncbi:MAG: NAD-dependent epimerase/dehydratase family protein [Deltaproteobacteria bacterium]|nr:MAG: NAD-dependent epimerase/dehydratase family protein [Deltaproteobacteria bacterium]
MNTILVTGGAGAIGSCLVKRLCRDHSILVLDDLSSGWPENLHGLPVKFWRGSVIDEEILREVFAAQPTIVYHLAANFANQNSVDYPQKDLLVNGMGTLKMLQYALNAGVQRFIYTSSSCVYGDISGPISELHRNYSLDTPYGVTKLLGEQYVNFFHEHHKFPTVILRLFNSYGPGEYPGKYRNVIPNFIYRALQGQPLIITGVGDETRDFTFVEDTVSAMVLAMSRAEAVGKTFNVGTGDETSIRSLAEAIREICGGEVPIEYHNRRDWDSISRRCADISFIQQTLGYKPEITLQEGLKRTYQWFLEKQLIAFKILL